MSPTRPRRTASSPEPPRPTFSADDIAASLADALRGQSSGEVGEGLTTQEIADLTGWPVVRVNAALQLLFRAKRLKTGRVPRLARDGAMRLSPIYTILPPVKEP